MRFPTRWTVLLSHPLAFRGLLALGLLIRVAWLVWQWDAPLLGDAAEYAGEAQRIASGEFTDGYWPPFLPHYLAVWLQLPGPVEGLVRLAMLPWFLLLGWELWHWGRRWAGPGGAAVAMGVAALYPALLLHGVEPLSQVPAGVLLLAFWAGGMDFVEGRGWRWGLVSALAGAALLLLRPSVLLLVVVLPVVGMLRWRTWRPALLMAVPLLLAWGWSSLLSERLDHYVWINSANARNVYLGNNAWTPLYKTWYFGSHWVGDPEVPEGFREALAEIESAPARERRALYLSAVVEEWRGSTGRSIGRTMSRVRAFWAFDSFAAARFLGPHDPRPGLGRVLGAGDGLAWAWLWLGAVGMFFLGARFRAWLVVGLLYAVPYYFSMGHPTFHMPVAVLWLLPAAAFWTRSAEERLTRRQWLWYGLLALMWLQMQVEWVWQMQQPVF